MRYETVLVTGGAGYLGAILVPKLLDRGFKVKLFDRFYFGKHPLSSVLDHPNLVVIEDDILYQENISDLFTDVSAVIHLASLSNDPSCDLDPNLTLRTNFISTMALARRAKEEGVGQFIFASSCSVYGAQSDEILTEESQTGPVTLYALTKLECERELARLANNRFVVVLPRLATLFGYSPRMRFDLAINIMVKRCLLGEGLIVNGDGRQYRPFLHVVDAADAFLAFLTADAATVNGQIFNVGNEDNNYTIKSLAEKIARAFPDTEIKTVLQNQDMRSYRVSFSRLKERLGIVLSKGVDYAIDEIKRAYHAGLLPNMNDHAYYNLLVLKGQPNPDVVPPVMALPTSVSFTRWSSVFGASPEASRHSVQAQAAASVAGRPKITAVILAYNCEKMLRRAYERIPKELINDLIVADDCSQDGTAKVAQDLGLQCFSNSTNLGYGGNLKMALKAAFGGGADYVVEVHGDGAQFNPISIKYSLPYIDQGYDLILGSRFVHPAKALKNGMPLVRFLANRFLSFCDRLVLKLPLTEFHTGFRIYSKKLYGTVPLVSTSNDYLFSFEIIAQSSYYGLKVGEVEVEADYHSEHTSHKLTGAAVYAIQTFGILCSFLLAKAGLKYSPLFLAQQARKREG